MKSSVFRIIASILATVVYGWVNAVLNPIATIAIASAAGKQLENSDSAAVAASFEMNFYGHIGLPAFILLGVLVLIWWGPLKNLKGRLFALSIMAFGAAFTMAPQPAQAYYDKTNLAEIYYVKPNETVFWIPDVGANINSQVQMDSAAYYDLNKVAAKRFSIPHVKLANSTGMMENDYYVPAGRLIVVERTPYSREWHGSATKGTSNKDESIVCQSQEGINVTFSVGITAQIAPQDAAKYLYSFGIAQNAGDQNSKEVIFASVYHSRSLNSVMDDIARTKAHSLLCRETGARSFDKVNTEASAIMDKVEASMTTFLKERGITLVTMGFADTLGFDERIQHAINDAYIAKTLGSSMAVLHAQADIEVKRGLAANLNKFAMPSFMPQGISDWFSGMFKSASAPAPAKK